ncbi:hypothetical protein RRG08_066446 [Elysia crispata]|uniref:Uncharacterized protein n=1 Tax=Elysia crispata TaxID=231223 RepID=A0AAE0ZDW4_9GAST|nr:hypothetical protein RRG08_066446 [Elysia crispata]
MNKTTLKMAKVIDKFAMLISNKAQLVNEATSVGYLKRH